MIKTNYRVHYRDIHSHRDKVMGIYCLEVAQELAMRKRGQIIDLRGVIIPRDVPSYCLQCELTHLP